jgi:hypothetical protein
LIRTNGVIEEVQPKNGKHFSLEEMQNFVGGYIEAAPTKDGRLLIVNEDGKMKKLPPNETATKLYQWGAYDGIVGDALIVTRKEMK